jgi:SWI/SNF-related matrix-associated actin-dependent regulator of chromatin subfamily A3
LKEVELRTAFANYCRSFCHAITKAKSSNLPSEIGGGVLADEMGMGKSLSILSLITKTLEHAHAWASNRSVSLSNETLVGKPTSRATLVVVSSSCKYSGYPHRRDLSNS